MIIVIPARGGSKRVPRKNIQPLHGKPLLQYTIDLLERANLGHAVYISTDDKAIADIAARSNRVRVVWRPAELSGDTVSTESVLLHVLDTLPAGTPQPEWVMTLPPTSPFRKVETIRRFITQIDTMDPHYDCVMSVTENRGDFWIENTDGSIRRLFPDAPRRQQQRKPLLEENSAIYLTLVKSLRDTGMIIGKNTKGITIPVLEGFDINTPEDFILAECILRSGLITMEKVVQQGDA